MRNNEEKQKFADRQAVWVQTHIEPVTAKVLEYATLTARGVPPAARVYLRDVTEHVATIADVSLASLVAGVVAGDGLTSLAGKTAKRVAEVTGKPLEDKQDIALGYLLLGIVCDVTGCAEIVARHGDRPNKTEGGVKIVVQYELVITKAQFIEDAAKFGRVGMPTFQASPARPWSCQDKGGVKGQQGGFMHGGERQMKGLSPDTAPALFAAVNAAQAVQYVVNPTTAKIVKEYDADKAMTWLTAHYIAKGLDPAKAAAKAKEDARL